MKKKNVIKNEQLKSLFLESLLNQKDFFSIRNRIKHYVNRVKCNQDLAKHALEVTKSYVFGYDAVSTNLFFL